MHALEARAISRRAAIARRVAMAGPEPVDPGCLAHVLHLTLLGPDIVEAILDGRQPQGLGLPALLEPFPAEWQRHHGALRGACSAPPPRRDPAAGTRPPGAQSTDAPERPLGSATRGSPAAKLPTGA